MCHYFLIYQVSIFLNIYLLSYNGVTIDHEGLTTIVLINRIGVKILLKKFFKDFLHELTKNSFI